VRKTVDRVVKAEFLPPSPRQWDWREQLANLDSYAQKIEESLTDDSSSDELVNTIPRLTVPALADICVVDVIENQRSVRCAFTHREPTLSVPLGAALARKPEFYDFSQGRRALAGEPVLFQVDSSFRRQAFTRTPEMVDLVRIMQPHSVIMVPITVLETTIAILAFSRTPASGLVHGAKELALAQEITRRALARQLFPRPQFRSSEDARLRRVDDFLRAHLAESFSLETLARHAGLSRFHLLRLFKEAYGEAPFKRL
jgi:hypothetical protein